MTVLSAATLLFLVMDPMGNISLFLTALKNVEASRQGRVVAREPAAKSRRSRRS